MQHILAQSITIGGSGGKGQSYTITGYYTKLPKDIGSLITQVIPFVFALAGIGLLLMIIAAGFTLMTSAGDAKKMEQGKNRLTFAIVGFLVIFFAFWIVQIFGMMFGVEPIQRYF